MAMDNSCPSDIACDLDLPPARDVLCFPMFFVSKRRKQNKNKAKLMTYQYQLPMTFCLPMLLDLKEETKQK